MLRYWNETLENISKDQRKDKFQIIVNNRPYEIPLSYALGISPLITEKYLKDPTFKKLTITVNNNEINRSSKEIQEEFSKFFKGEKISSELFCAIAINLENKEMINEWSKCSELTKENIIKRIKAKHQISSNLSYNKKMTIENLEAELKYFEEHFEEMKEDIDELSDEELIFILKNDKIKVEKEDIIWEIVKKRIDMNNKRKSKENIVKGEKNIKSLLLGTIEVNYLKKEYFQEYIEIIEEEDIENESKIFKKIKEILIKNIDNIILEGKEINQTNIINIQHKEGNNFDGIIRYLEIKHGTNIHEQGIISITSSSTSNYKPEQVIDYDWNNHWNSKDTPNNWLEINFKELKVKINGYSLKSPSCGSNWHHLKNWVIEGSKDKNNWIIIDKKVNDSNLNRPPNQNYFPLSNISDDYQYIRIRSIGKNHANYDVLIITNFEIYGEIITNSKENILNQY